MLKIFRLSTFFISHPLAILSGDGERWPMMSKEVRWWSRDVAWNSG